jgi:glycosyltransferase involved in cell wall biosynthesis
MKLPMRIAMIGTRGLPATHGGVERAVEALSRHLALLGHEVTVYGRRGYCADDWDADGSGVRQIVLPAANTKHLEAVSHTMAATAHALASSRRYDVVHFHATGPSLFAGAMRLRNVPTVATVQGLDWKRAKWGPVATGVLKIAARAAATVPTETIVVSRQLRQDLRSAYGAQSTYIPNGVDFSDIEMTPTPVEGLTPGNFILFLGRLVPEKAPDTLIEAFRRIDTDASLVIAGPALYAGDYEARLRQVAAGDGRVRFTGPQYGAEKAWLLRNARVFVQPSTLEGLPIAVLEALALGTQVLVSDIPENVEAITIDGELRGRTFQVSDVASLAARLSEYLASGTNLVPSAREAARRAFDWSAIASETERVYQRALRIEPGGGVRPRGSTVS